jgi:hypothetical protein
MPIISEPYNDQRNTLTQSLMKQAVPGALRQLSASTPNAGGASPQQMQQPNAQPGMMPGTVPGAQPQLDPGMAMQPPQPPQQMMPMSMPPAAQGMPMNPGMPDTSGMGGTSAGSKGAGAQPPAPVAQMKAGM